MALETLALGFSLEAIGEGVVYSLVAGDENASLVASQLVIVSVVGAVTVYVDEPCVNVVGDGQ